MPLSHCAGRQLWPRALFLPHSCYFCSQCLACCWDRRVSSQGLVTDEPSCTPASAQACPLSCPLYWQLPRMPVVCSHLLTCPCVGSRQKHPMPVCDTGDFDGNGKDPGRVVETQPLSHTSDRGLNVRGAGQEKHEWGGAPKSLLGHTWSQSTTPTHESCCLETQGNQTVQLQQGGVRLRGSVAVRLSSNRE